MAYQASSTASSPSRAPTELPTAFSIPPTHKDADDLVQQQSSPSNLSLHFTQSQLTLAFAIQRSKPAGSSADEYYAQLQKHRRRGKPDSGTNRRYIDTSEFWKDQFDKVYQEKKAVERKLYLLEERQRQQGVVPLLNQDQETTIATIRNYSAEDQQSGEFLQRKESEATTSHQDIILTLSSYIVRIAQQCKALKKFNEKCNLPTDVEYLSTSCIQSTVLLEEAVNDCSVPLWYLKCNADRRVLSLVEQLMGQISRCFEACFSGLNELCGTILGRQTKLGVLDRMICFFGKALDHLHTICNIQAEYEIETSRQRELRRGTEAQVVNNTEPQQPFERARINMEASAETDDNEYAINKYLTNALESMTCLQWTPGQPGHRDLLEGMLFFIIEHTGKLVSNAVFNEHVATCSRPGNITKDGSTLSPKASNLETRYMIKILAASLGRSCAKKDLVAHVLAEEIGRATLYESSRKPSDHSTDILAKARKRIQCSLFKSVVGGRVEDGLVLSKPSSPEAGVTNFHEIRQSGEKYGTDWLLASVWALVGWEMMF